MEAGATIPEMDAVSSHDPRQLMAPELKQLAAPPTEEVSGEPELLPGFDIESLTGEELALLEETLAKSRGEESDTLGSEAGGDEDETEATSEV